MAENAFLSFTRRNVSRILKEHGDPLAFCSALAISQPIMRTAVHANSLLPERRDERDYYISTAYALMLGGERRKTLSAYFTPPVLADAAIKVSARFVFEQSAVKVLDPACGGGSFLGPMLRFLVSLERDAGHCIGTACTRALEALRGIEIDPGLANLSSLLLNELLTKDLGYVGPKLNYAVEQGDSLSIVLNEKFDLIIGNPPYGRVGRGVDPDRLAPAGMADLGGHTNIYGLFVLRALDWLKPHGGLVFILPTSFIAGPYFAGFRHEVLARAEVVSIDLHEQRENLFVGAVQDVCILVLQRRLTPLRTVATEQMYELGVIDAIGNRQVLGTATATSGGEPWTLPVPGQVRGSSPRNVPRDQTFTLADYGYRMRVGKVVPTRERSRLADYPSNGSLPLVWASDVRPDGTFSFGGMQRKKTAAWYLPPCAEVPYATRMPCVLVQRTSNRDQRRRLNAAAVPDDFLRTFGKHGFVAENHVIVLEASSDRPAVPPQAVAAILNAASTNERFSAVSGTFSISAKLLARLALPSPVLLPNFDAPTFAEKLRVAFDSVRVLLAPLQPTGDGENGPDQARHLSSSSTIDQYASLKRRAVA